MFLVTMEYIVFYDSKCGVCSKFVQWIIKRDKNHQFKFSSLYGEFASKMLSNIYPNYLTLNSVIVLKNHTIYIKFEAIIEILVALYPFLSKFKYILTFKLFVLFGNFFYVLFANSKLRKQIQKEECLLIRDLKYEDKFIV